MIIQINPKLTKSRNPVEHHFKLEGQKGEIIQTLGDGYHRIRFDQFKIKKQVKLKKTITWQSVSLEWYVHELDFHLPIKLNK